MTLQHAKPGEALDLSKLNEPKSVALVKHERFEVMTNSLLACGFILKVKPCMPSRH